MRRPIERAIAGRRTARSLAGAALFMVVAVAAPATADPWVVVASNTPQVPRGTVLDGEEDLELSAGESLTLVSKSGELIELEGPRKGPPAPAEGGGDGADASGDAGLVFALGRLFDHRKTEETPGVFRAGADAARPEEPWWIDATRSGYYCAEGGRQPLLWRPVAGAAETVAVKHLPGGAWVEARWADGAATVSWPAEVPIEDGASYSVRKGEAAAHRQIVLRVVAADPGDELRRLVALVQRGCLPQAETLAERLE